MRILIQMIYPAGIEAAGSSDYPMDFIPIKTPSDMSHLALLYQ